MIIATVINFSFMILECFSTPSCFQDLNLALYFLVLLKVILDFFTVQRFVKPPPKEYHSVYHKDENTIEVTERPGHYNDTMAQIKFYS